MLVAKITIGDWPNASPTPHSCHQYILYPTFITNIECNQNIRLIQWNREGQIYLDTDSSAGKDISTVAQIPTDLKCFTITNPHVSDPGGHFKMEIQFSDWLHEIDHSVHIWNGEQYTICYKSFPNTLKLIIQDSNFRSSFELLYKVNVLIIRLSGRVGLVWLWSPLNERFFYRNTNAFIVNIEATTGTELTGLICDAGQTNSGCSIGHDSSSPKNAYKKCWKPMTIFKTFFRSFITAKTDRGLNCFQHKRNL